MLTTRIGGVVVQRVCHGLGRIGRVLTDFTCDLLVAALDKLFLD